MVGKPDIWMPLYIAPYLAATTHLTTEEHGAYLLLLMTGWKRGGALPDDDKQLAAIAKLTPKRWSAVRATLAAFYEVADGRWRQARQTAELTKAERISEMRQEAGKRGGNAKANAKQVPQQTGQQTPKQPATPLPLHPTGNPTDSPPGRSQARGARWSAEVLSEEWLGVAKAEGLSPAQAAHEFAKIGDWARHKGETSKDWTARWRNWVRKAVNDGKQHRPVGQQPRTESGDRAAILEGLGLAQGMAAPRDPAGGAEPGPATVDLGLGEFARAS